MLSRMGVHVHLAVAVDRISRTAWREIYDKARRVAKQWTPRPLSVAWRQIGAVRVAQYTLDLETTDGLHIVGDAETLTTGESFRFPANPGCASPSSDGPLTPSHDDVLVAVARRNDPEAEPRCWHDLFGAKTQGLPYHVLIVALGLLVESSLPGTAVVYGDISLQDGQEARCAIARILGEELELPVVVDDDRLRRRLAAGLRADALEEAIDELREPDLPFGAILGDLLGRIRDSPDGRMRHELEHAVCSCRDLNLLATETRQLLHALLEKIRAHVVRAELRERAEQWGAARTCELVARGTQDRGLRLTSMAWDEIEAADLDELALLLAATCVDTTTLEVHQAVRAVLENRALRRA